VRKSWATFSAVMPRACFYLVHCNPW
jgi:hypothetical protein